MRLCLSSKGQVLQAVPTLRTAKAQFYPENHGWLCISLTEWADVIVLLRTGLCLRTRRLLLTVGLLIPSAMHVQLG
jgi:hypothetical protein